MFFYLSNDEILSDESYGVGTVPFLNQGYWSRSYARFTLLQENNRETRPHKSTPIDYRFRAHIFVGNGPFSTRIEPLEWSVLGLFIGTVLVKTDRY